MAKLRKMPKTFNQMRNDRLNNRRSAPMLDYRSTPKTPKVKQGYTTPEGVYMSAEYIDNLQTDKPHGEGKGEKGKNCNREACQAPGAYWYNHSTQRYYCTTCARLINRDSERFRDSFVESLGHPLLTLDPDFAEMV